MTNRHVPLIFGIVAIGGAVALAVSGFGWWKYLIGTLLLASGWASLKTAWSATDQEIEELTTNTPASEETKKRFMDRI